MRFGTFALLALVAYAPPPAAREYADPTGFSLPIPEGWVAVTTTNLNGLEPDLRRWIETNKIDLSKIKVFLTPTPVTDFAENINVAVSPKAFPINERSTKEFAAAFPEQGKKMGVEVTILRAELQQIAGRTASVVEFETRMPFVPETMRQRQVTFSGGGKTYLVTCAAKLSDAERCGPVFDAILAGFKCPEPDSAPLLNFDFSRLGDGVLSGSILGAVVGVTGAALFMLLRLLSGGKKTPPSGGDRASGQPNPK